MESSSRHGDREAYFLDWLDGEPVTRRGQVVLVAAAAALVCFALPDLPTLFVRIAVAGLRSQHPSPWLLLRHLLADGAIACAAGVLAGAAFRRLKWLAGPVLLLIPLIPSVIAALLPSGRVGTFDGHAIVRTSVGLDTPRALYLGALFLLSALGGTTSPRLFRRLPLGLGADVALAWAGGAMVAGWAFWPLLFSKSLRMPTGDASFAFMFVRSSYLLPSLVSGLWLGWALRRRPWVAATALPIVVGLRVAAGQIYFKMPGLPASVLTSISFLCTCGLAASLGGWLGGVAARQRPGRELLTPVFAFGGVAVAMAVVAAAASMLLGTEAAGTSSAVEPPVLNGDVVLLAKGKAIGALILNSQTVTPERVSYTWYYRTDGGGTFRASEAKRFHSGQVKDATQVSFGPFSVSWSAHDGASGYLYYAKASDAPVAPDDLRICNTGETDLEQINALDSWRAFKASPSDQGRPLARGAPQRAH